MKKVFFALIFNFFVINFAFALSNDDRFVKECVSLVDKPSVKIKSSYGKLRYDFGKDAKFLTSKTAKKYTEYGLRFLEDFEVAGLTVVSEGIDVDIEVGMVSVSKGNYCVYPKNIEAFLGYYSPTIYVLNSLKKGSCAYDVALRHEKTHMQIYIEALDYFLPTFKKYVNDLFEIEGVKIISDRREAENAARELSDKYMESVKNRINSWRKEVEAEQLKLDSKENYILENRICADVVK